MVKKKKENWKKKILSWKFSLGKCSPPESVTFRRLVNSH